MLLHTVEHRVCAVGLNPSAVFIIGPTSLVVGHASHAPGRKEVMAGHLLGSSQAGVLSPAFDL